MKLEKPGSFGWGATAAGYAPCKNGLVVHYDGSNQGLAKKSHDSCRAYWRATRTFHRGPARGWADIGYSFGVCPHGIVMEGRGWQRQQAAQPGGNSSWTSVTFMSGEDERPTDAQVRAFKELWAWLRGKGLAKKSHDSCRAYWKATRTFHRGPARGWADIGYSFGVCPHGIVMEGRGWQRQQAAQPGGNSSWTSVTFMSGEDERPTDAQVRAFKELRAWLRGKGLAAAISYHGRFTSTSCPGKILRGMVASGALAGSAASNETEDMVKKLPTLGRGDSGEHVQTLRALLLARSHPEIGKVEGAFDAKVETAVKAVQKWGGVEDDGVVGPKTWPVLLRVH